MCTNSIEDIPLSELGESAYSVLSKHLDTLNTRRRDWKGLASAINLNLTEMNLVEACNEHCKKLIEIWNTYSPPPVVKDLLELLEEKGCEKAIKEFRQIMETDLSSQPKQPIKIRFTANPEPTNIQVCGPGLIPLSSSKLDSLEKTETESMSDPLSPTTPTTPTTPITSQKEIPSKPDCTPTIETPVLESETKHKHRTIQDGFFVSFHNNDSIYGEEIISEMKKRGVNVYSEQDVIGGDSEIIKREELFSKSRAVIAVITPHYCSDEGYQLLEGMSGVIAAPAGTKRTFIPVICESSDLPSFIKMRSKIFWDRTNKFDQLYNSIKSIK